MNIAETAGALQIALSDHPNGVVVCALIGSADMRAADDLDRQVMLLCTRHPSLVVFDINRLTFVSSICMGSLLRYSNACKHWHGRANFAGPGDSLVWQAFQRARLDTVFPCFASVEEAIAGKRNAPSRQNSGL